LFYFFNVKIENQRLALKLGSSIRIELTNSCNNIRSDTTDDRFFELLNEILLMATANDYEKLNLNTSIHVAVRALNL
jgi:hypothetical protein